MGCFPLHHLLKACSTAGASKIKVMTVEGRCLRFTAPIIVKEVLMEYPSHAIFLSDSVRSLGDCARPLHNTVSLQPGFLYFLVPQLPTAISSRSHSAAPMETSEPASAPSKSTRQRKVSFAIPANSTHSPACEERGAVDSAAIMSTTKLSVASSAAAAAIESLKKSAVEFLPAPSEGVLRLKMVVSKRQLARVLKEGGDYMSMVEGLLAPLLQEAAATSKNSRHVACNVSWRPSLQSIPESTLPASP